MSKVDLHTHSTASDGKLTPGALVAKAADCGLRYLSLSDHDTIDGIAQALEAGLAFPQLKIIPGVEISTDVPDGEIHVLGYFIDYRSVELNSALERFRGSRQRRARGMIEKLRHMGINIDWPRVQEIAGEGSIGRPHIARAMLEKGYIGSFGEAFTRYLGRNGPAYVERDKMTPAEAVALIARSNGLPVMAHPFTIEKPDVIIRGLLESGLVGVEAYYNGYTTEQIKSLVSLAEKHNLIPTGGSDYHGLEDGSEAMLGSVDVPVASAERLVALAEGRADDPTER